MDRNNVMNARRIAAVMGLLVFAHGCGNGNPCPGVSTLDDELASTCGEPVAAADAGTTACTPRPGTICTVVGTGTAGAGTNNVLGTLTDTYLPQDVAVAPDGRDAYFVDWNNHVIRVLHASDQTVQTVVGSGELSDADSYTATTANTTPSPALNERLNHPTGIVFDPTGRMIIAAWHNSKLKRVTLNPDPTMNMIVDICGTGARSYGGDNGPALLAALNLPVQTAVAPDGTVWLADQANQRIRRVDGAGIITTVVGNGTAGYTGDNGPATMAELNNPVGQAAAPAGRIVFDSTGNLYIADTGNNAVRRVDTHGIITTVAGTGMAGYSGDGGPATMAEINGPADVAIGPDGTLFIADTQNSCVRSVTADHTIHTVAGRCGTNGFGGDGGSPTAALLNRPFGIDVDASHRIWIADTYNQRIRVVLAQ